MTDRTCDLCDDPVCDLSGTHHTPTCLSFHKHELPPDPLDGVREDISSLEERVYELEDIISKIQRVLRDF
jgi:hypothetical protein